jgi:hypothetical protein
MSIDAGRWFRFPKTDPLAGYAACNGLVFDWIAAAGTRLEWSDAARLVERAVQLVEIAHAALEYGLE